MFIHFLDSNLGFFILFFVLTRINEIEVFCLYWYRRTVHLPLCIHQFHLTFIYTRVSI
uniref:Uncharacterized protein n=1 Tax=Brassica oleracea var. oleracea TaxID=109376 RepID=A0A0D3ASG6_BRAOL